MEGAGSPRVEEDLTLLLEGGDVVHGTLALHDLLPIDVAAKTTHSLSQGSMLHIPSDIASIVNISLPRHTG